MNSLPPSFAREVQRILDWAVSRCTTVARFQRSTNLDPWTAATHRRFLPGETCLAPIKAVSCHRTPKSPLRSTLASRPSTAFTLIELLVVISIIAILAGLAFPAVMGALNTARKAEARNDVNQIANAIRNFKLEYKRLPEEGTEIDVLKAAESQKAQNPKGLVFLEMKNATGNPPKKGYKDGQMYDPWGVAYKIILDGGSEDTDSKVNNKIIRDGTEYITQVIVESEGGSPNDKNRKPISNVQ